MGSSVVLSISIFNNQFDKCFQTIFSFLVTMVLQMSYTFSTPEQNFVGSNSDSTEDKVFVNYLKLPKSVEFFSR